MSGPRQQERTNLDLDNAACDRCGRSLFRHGGVDPGGHWTEWTPAQLRQFIADSWCAYEGCEGRPLVPVGHPAEAEVTHE